MGRRFGVCWAGFGQAGGRRQEARDRTVAERAASPACNNAPQGFPFAASATSTTQVLVIIGSVLQGPAKSTRQPRTLCSSRQNGICHSGSDVPCLLLIRPNRRDRGSRPLGVLPLYVSRYFPKGDGRPMNNEVHLQRNPLIAVYRLVGLASAFVSRLMARVARWV